MSVPFGQSEKQLQRAVVALLSWHEKQGHCRFYHIPNQLPRPKTLSQMVGHKAVTMIYAMIDNSLKAMGKRKGVPDLCILFPDGRSAYWELKIGTGKTTPEQKDWLDWFDKSGFGTAVIRDVADAEIILRDFIKRAA